MPGYEALHGDGGVDMGDVTAGRDKTTEEAVRTGLARLFATFPNFTVTETEENYQNYFVFRVRSGIVSDADKHNISKRIAGSAVDGLHSGTIIRIPRSIVDTLGGMLPSKKAPESAPVVPPASSPPTGDGDGGGSGSKTGVVGGVMPKPTDRALSSVMTMVISILFLFFWIFYFGGSA